MSTSGMRQVLGEAMARMPYNRGRLELLVPRGRRLTQANGHHGRRFSPPAPLNEDALDFLAWFDWTVLRLDSLAALRLGDREAGFKLHALCPYCDLGELVCDMESGIIRCGAWPTCADPEGRRYQWLGEAGFSQLAALLAARDVQAEQAAVG
jgi:hypothetical protein